MAQMSPNIITEAPSRFIERMIWILVLLTQTLCVKRANGWEESPHQH